MNSTRRVIQVVIDTAGAVRPLRDINREADGLVGRSRSLSRAAADVTDWMRQWTRRGSEVAKAELQAAMAAREKLSVVKQGPAAIAAKNAEEEKAAALAKAGVSAESALGKTILNSIAIRQRAVAALHEYTRAQAEAARAQARASSVVADVRSRVVAKEGNAEALRQGAAASRAFAEAERIRIEVQRAGVAATSAEARELANLIRREIEAERATEALTRAKERARNVISGLRSSIFSLQSALAALGLGLLVRESKEIALEFQRLDNLFKVAAGSSTGARAEMQNLREEGERLGFSIRALGKDYGQFLVAAASTPLRGEPARQIFISIAEAMTVMGASSDQQHRAMLALQQMMSKGNIQAEELRGQLGEALPGAFSIFAQALGVTEVELNNMLDRGEVLAKDTLPKVAAKIRELYGSQVQDAAQRAQADLGRFQNALDEVKRNFGEGFLIGYVQGLRNLRKELTSEEFKVAARSLGKDLGEGARKAAESIAFLVKYLEDLKAIVIGVAIAFAGWKLMALIAGLRGLGAAWTALSGLLAANPLGAALVAVGALTTGVMLLIRSIDDGSPALTTFDNALLQHRDILFQVKATTLELAEAQSLLARQSAEALQRVNNEIASAADSLRRQIEQAERTRASDRASNRFRYGAGQTVRVGDEAARFLPDVAGETLGIEQAKQALKSLEQQQYNTAFSATEAARKADEFEENLGKLRKESGATSSGLKDLSDEARKLAERIQELLAKETLLARQAAARAQARLHGADALEDEIRNQEVENKLRESGIRLSEREISVLIAGGRVLDERANKLRDSTRSQQESALALEGTISAEQKFVASLVEASQAMTAWVNAGHKRTEEIKAQGKAFSDEIRRIQAETRTVHTGGLLPRAETIEAEVERAVAAIERVATESEDAYRARLATAREQARAAITDLFDARDVAEFKARAEEMARSLREPFLRASQEVWGGFESRLVDAAATGKLTFQGFWEEFRVSAARALLDFLKRWAITMAQAKAMKASLDIAGGGTGGGFSWLGLFKGGGGRGANLGTLGADAATLDRASGATASTGLFTGGTGGYGSVGAYAQTFGWILPVAIGLYAVYKGFIEKSKEWAEVSLGGASAGNASKVSATVRRRVNEILQTVQKFAADLDVTIEKMGEVVLGKRGKSYYVKDSLTTGAVAQAFSSAEAAMEYAAVRAVQLAQLGNDVSAMVRATIQGSRAQTLDGLQSDIARMRSIEERGKPEIFARMRAMVNAFVDEMKWIRETLRNSVLERTSAMRLSIEGLVTGLVGVYNEITGKKPDLEEQKRLIAETFNAQKKIALAKVAIEIASLKAELARIRGINAGTAAVINSGTAHANTALLMAKANVVLGASSEDAVRAMEDLIAYLEGVRSQLEGLADLKPEDVRLGGGGGGDRQQSRDDFQARLRELREGAMNDAARAVSEFITSLREFERAAREGNASAAERAEGERLLRDQLRKTIEEIIAPYTRDFGKTDFQKQVEAERRKVEEARQAAATKVASGTEPARQERERRRRNRQPTGSFNPKTSRAAGGPTTAAGGQRRRRGQETPAQQRPPARRVGPSNATFDTAQRNLTLEFTRRLDSDIASASGTGEGLAAVQTRFEELRANLNTLGLDASETAKRLRDIALGEWIQTQQGQLGVMDKLFGYLKGSEKHAATVAEHEKKKIELDFLILRAQLDAWKVLNPETEALLRDAKEIALSAIQPAIAAANTAQEAAARKQEEAARIQEEAARRFRESTDRLLEFQRSLLTEDAYSFLNPKEQVEEARKYLQQVRERALAGDLDARERYEAAARSFLDEYAGTFGRDKAFMEESRRIFDDLSRLASQTRFALGNVSYGGFPQPAPYPLPAAAAVNYVAPSTASSSGGGDLSEVLRLLRQMGTDAAVYYDRDTQRGVRNEERLATLLTKLEEITARLGRVLAHLEAA